MGPDGVTKSLPVLREERTPPFQLGERNATQSGKELCVADSLGLLVGLRGSEETVNVAEVLKGLR